MTCDCAQVPLVSSLEGVGWRERRQSSEGWFCSWTPDAVPRRNRGQLPNNLVGYTSLLVISLPSVVPP